MKPKQNSEARLRVDFSKYTDASAGRVVFSKACRRVKHGLDHSNT